MSTEQKFIVNHCQPLNPLEVANQPWETISVDLVGPLPESKGFKTPILVIVDSLTKMKILIPTNDNLSSLGWALILRRSLFRLHGLPKKIVSDRGPQFVSSFIRDLYKLLGISGAPSTAYHPQTDGQTEHADQEMEQYLAAFVNHRQDDWSEWLDLAEFIQNDHFHAGTKQTPFLTNYGFHPWKGQKNPFQSKHPASTEFVNRLHEIKTKPKPLYNLLGK